MKSLSVLLRTSFVLLILITTQIHESSGQKLYRNLYSEYADTVYFEKLIRQQRTQQYDSMVAASDVIFEKYYSPEKPEQAVYMFITAVHHPTGSPLNEQVIQKIDAKLDRLRKECDTLNVHFGTLLQLKGFAYKYQYRMEEAMSFFRQTESLFKQIDAPKILIHGLYQSMGSSLITLNENYTAYQYLKKTLPVFKDENMLHELSFSYLEIARSLSVTNQEVLAYEFTKKAFDIISKNFPDNYNNVVVASNLAHNCNNIGKYDQALYYAAYADSCMKANGYTDALHMVYFSILANNGIAYKETGQYEKANESFTALKEQVIKYKGPDSPILANVYPEFAYNFLAAGRADSALLYLEKTKTINPDFQNYLAYKAQAYALKDDYDNAVKALKKNLTALSNSSDKKQYSNILSTYESCASLSNNYLELHRQNNNSNFLDSSLHYLQKADSLIREKQSRLLIGGDDISFAKKYHQLAETGLSAFFEMHTDQKKKYENLPFALISQATAFKLNAETSDIQKFDKNIQEQLKLQQEIRRIDNQLLAMQQDSDSEKELFRQTEQKLFETRIQAFELAYEKNTDSEKHSPLTKMQDADFSAIQKRIEKDEALWIYFLGEEHLYITAIGKKNIEIKRQSSGKELRKLLQLFYKDIKTGSPNFNETSQKLYSYLVSPIAPDFGKLKKITIIPDGMLNRIPFDALVLPDNKFLIEKTAISYHYSVPLWLKSKNKKAPKQLSFTGFAPVFSESQPGETELLLNYAPNMRSAYSDIIRNEKLAPLPFSEEELRTVHQLFTKANMQSKILLHEQANEKNFKAESQTGSIVHIATHGISSYQSPELSGLFFYKEDHPDDVTNDGFLYAGEIYMLETEADLMVLSACKSGAGTIYQGEGVMALPRPFIYIDVPNLVASLWKIHDEKTKHTMTDFYQEIIGGESYAQALRRAKISAINRGELPSDWAALILIGR